jgi:hypothetical protein
MTNKKLQQLKRLYPIDGPGQTAASSANSLNFMAIQAVQDFSYVIAK